jgi:hypothetical protein
MATISSVFDGSLIGSSVCVILSISKCLRPIRLISPSPFLPQNDSNLLGDSAIRSSEQSSLERRMKGMACEFEVDGGSFI